MSTPGLRDNGLGATGSDARDRLAERRLGGEWDHRALNAGVDRHEVGVERIDQRKMLLEQEGVVRRESPTHGLAQLRALLTEAALRAGRELGGIVDTQGERFENRAPRLAHDVGDDATELELGQLQDLGDAIDVMTALSDEALA